MKKGEVQLQESILVTFFIIVIIGLSLILYYKFTLNSVDNYERDYMEQQLLSALMTLPNDFSYTYLGENKNAIDSSKLFYDKLDYGAKTIIIEQTYPIQENSIKCDIANYPDCNYFVVYNKTNVRLKNNLVQSIPVSIYYPLDDSYRLGKLSVYLYY